MPEIVYSVLGILGAGLILLGFYRTSIGQWKSKSFWYEIDNTLGAIFLATYQYHLHAYISMLLNVIWAIVAFRGLSAFAERYSASKHRKRSKPRSH